MTNLSDADREMAVKILEAWCGYPISDLKKRIDRTPQDAADMAATACTLVTAKILAAAGLDEEGIVEALATAFEADMFASHELPLEPELHAKYVGSARAVFALIKPTLARLAAENARMREALIAAEAWIVDGGHVDRDPSAAAVYAQTRAALGDQP